MKIELLDIYRNPDSYDSYVKFLYNLLSHRKDWQNISHSKMPMYNTHCEFIASKPYYKWYIIVVDDFMVGAMYLTNQYEIGVHLTEPNQGKKLGPAILKYFISKHNMRPLYANINPRNARSIHVFTGLGFEYSHKITRDNSNETLQVTYVLN